MVKGLTRSSDGDLETVWGDGLDFNHILHFPVFVKDSNTARGLDLGFVLEEFSLEYFVLENGEIVVAVMVIMGR